MASLIGLKTRNLEIFFMKDKLPKCTRGESRRMKNMVDAENALQRLFNPCKCQHVTMRNRSFSLKPDDDIIIISERFKELCFFLCSRNPSDAPNVSHVNPRDLICVAFEVGFESVEKLKEVLSKETPSVTFEIFYKGTKLYNISQLRKHSIPDDRCFEIELINVKEKLIEVKYARDYFTSVTLHMECLSTDTFTEISMKVLDELGIEDDADMRMSMCIGTDIMEHDSSICSVDEGNLRRRGGRTSTQQKCNRSTHAIAFTFHVYPESSHPIVINLPESEQKVAYYKKEDSMKELHNEIGKSIQSHPSSFQIGVHPDKSRKGKTEAIKSPADLWKDCEISFLDRIVLKCRYDKHSFFVTMFIGQSVHDLKREISKEIGIDPFLIDLLEGKSLMDSEDLVDRFAGRSIEAVRNPERLKIRLYFCGNLKEQVQMHRIIELQNIFVISIGDIIQEIASHLNKDTSLLQAIHNGSCLIETITVKDAEIRHLDFISITEIVPPIRLPFQTRVVFFTNMKGLIEGKTAIKHGGILFYGPGDLSVEESRGLFEKHVKGMLPSSKLQDSRKLNQRETKLMRSYESPSRPTTNSSGIRPLRSQSAVEIGSNVTCSALPRSRSVVSNSNENDNGRFGHGKLGTYDDSLSLSSARSPSLVSLSSQEVLFGGVDNAKLVGTEAQAKMIFETENSVIVRNISIKDEVQRGPSEWTDFKDFNRERSIEKRKESQFYTDIALEIGKMWKSVGRTLGVGDIHLEEIESLYQGLKERSYQMLMQWRKMYGQEATRDKLKDALIENSLRSVAESI